MGYKIRNKYDEEMCNICLDEKYGFLYVKGFNSICEDCCKDIEKELKKYRLE